MIISCTAGPFEVAYPLDRHPFARSSAATRQLLANVPAHACLYMRAGRPLPPLFNWQPAELDSCSAEVQAVLTSGGGRSAAGGAGAAAAADASSGGPSSSLG